MEDDRPNSASDSQPTSDSGGYKWPTADPFYRHLHRMSRDKETKPVDDPDKAEIPENTTPHAAQILADSYSYDAPRELATETQTELREIQSRLLALAKGKWVLQATRVNLKAAALAIAKALIDEGVAG